MKDRVTIDLARCAGSPTYRGSGFIYGIARDAGEPPDRVLTDVATRFLRAGGSQTNCPKGGYVNGDYEPRWQSARAYFEKAKSIGATFELMPSDLWGADAVCEVPRWPGDGGDWTEYSTFMDRVIADARAAGMTGSNVRWDLWNEADLDIFWGPGFERFVELWDRGFKQLRAALPDASIVGPSLSWYPSEGNDHWTTWLDAARAGGTIPDYISWHGEQGDDDPVSEAQTLDSMLAARGIVVTGYDMNEYGTRDEQNPGRSAWFIARLERARGGIDGARGNWAMGDGLYGGMGGMVNGDWQPTGQWWIYRRYAQQTGSRTTVEPGDQLDAVAFQDERKRRSIAVVGNRGGCSGEAGILVRNAPSWLTTGGLLHVLVERMPSGTDVLAAPLVVADFRVTADASLVIPIDWTDPSDGYVITLGD